MFGLEKIFSKKERENIHLSKEQIAEILKTNPEALRKFEEEYQKHSLDRDETNLFSVNSRMAAQALHESYQEEPMEYAEDLIKRIVSELVAQTPCYVFDGDKSRTETPKALPSGTKEVTSEEVQQLSESMRPQLTGNLMKVDIKAKSYESILYFLHQSQTAKTEELKKFSYYMFRQGLDILDLDPITYRIIGMNKNSMGFWFPKLVSACVGSTFFRIPATRIVKVPITLLQLTRVEYMSLTPTTLRIVDEWAKEVFALQESKEYFVKTGTYSSKFDFRNCWVHGSKEVRELGEYLLFIHFQALQMASPLAKPTITGASTTNEWVVREFIHDKEGNPTIYNGLPLHTEYRVFVDCDTDTVLSIAPYWEPETMKKRFNSGSEKGNVHDLHDYVIYQSFEEKLMQRYEENKDKVVEEVKKILPGLDLSGQWSIDIMQNGDDFWIIDMALAECSAFYETVPESLRKPTKENWIPKLES